MIDFQLLNDTLKQRALEVLQDICPGGKLKGHEYIAATKSGGDGSSFNYNINKMTGSDFASGESFGDLVSLYAGISGSSQIDSAKYLAERFCPKAIKQDDDVPKDNIKPVMFLREYGKAVCSWAYHRSDGAVLFYMARFNKKDGGKEFRPYLFTNTGWKQKAHPSPRPLYNIPELVNNKSLPVLVVEGEKTAEAAKAQLAGKFVVTTWPHGAKSVSKADWSLLKDRDVIIWPDRDKPGLDAAKDIKSILASITKSLKIIDVGEGDDGFDAADFKGNMIEFVEQKSILQIKPVLSIIDDDPGEITLKLAQQLCSENKFITIQEFGKVYIYKDGVYTQIKAPKCDAILHRMIMSNQSGKKMTPAKRNDVIRNIEAITAVREEEVNPDKVFNFIDGVFDIDKDKFVPHSPEILSTIQLPYKYGEAKPITLWMKFLSDVTGKDKDKINILQEFAGYCLARSCRFEKALFLIGSGSNGKSVFAETITSVFGKQNVSSVSLESLSNPVLRCNILNKFINIDSDLPRNAERFEEIFRKISSGEPVQFNEKFVPSYTTAPYCKLIYCLNEFPAIDDTSEAFYRRMILINFNVEFKDGNKDISLKEKLKQELPGIFRWCVEGYKRLTNNNSFTRSKDNDKNILEIKKDNNPILAFAENELIFQEETECKAYAIKKSELYKEYKRWVSDHGHRPLSFRKFNTRFYISFRNKTEKDYQEPSSARERAWPGVKYANFDVADSSHGQIFINPD